MGEKRGIFLKIVVRGATFVYATGLVEKNVNICIPPLLCVCAWLFVQNCVGLIFKRPRCCKSLSFKLFISAGEGLFSILCSCLINLDLISFVFLLQTKASCFPIGQR
jgi:hypothetical protein